MQWKQWNTAREWPSTEMASGEISPRHSASVIVHHHQPVTAHNKGCCYATISVIFLPDRRPTTGNWTGNRYPSNHLLNNTNISYLSIYPQHTTRTPPHSPLWTSPVPPPPYVIGKQTNTFDIRFKCLYLPFQCVLYLLLLLLLLLLCGWCISRSILNSLNSPPGQHPYVHTLGIATTSLDPSSRSPAFPPFISVLLVFRLLIPANWSANDFPLNESPRPIPSCQIY